MDVAAVTASRMLPQLPLQECYRMHRFNNVTAPWVSEISNFTFWLKIRNLKGLRPRAGRAGGKREEDCHVVPMLGHPEPRSWLCWPILGLCWPILALGWGYVDPSWRHLGACVGPSGGLRGDFGLCCFHDFTFIPKFCLKKLPPVACESHGCMVLSTICWSLSSPQWPAGFTFLHVSSPRGPIRFNQATAWPQGKKCSGGGKGGGTCAAVCGSGQLQMAYAFLLVEKAEPKLRRKAAYS